MPPLLRIRVLGQASLSFSGPEAVPPGLLQPRKVAFLAYLGVEDRPVSRDELTALLWAEVPQSRARASLNQLIHRIRRDCSADVICSEGPNLSLNPGLVTCDAAEFYRSLEAAAPEELLRVFAPRFMPGFTLAGESGFDEWQMRQSQRYDLAVADAAWRAAGNSGDHRRALQYLILASRLRPFDEVILRQRMRLLAQHGSPAEALSAYEEYRQRAAHELGVGPAPETKALASELMSLGEGLALEQSGVVEASTAAAEEQILEQSRQTQPSLRRRIPLMAAGVCVVIAAAVVGVLMSRSASAASDGRPSITLAGLTVAGGDEQRRGEFHHRLMGILADDTTFEVTLRPGDRSDLVVSGELKLESDRTHGTLLLTDGSGRVLRSLAIAHAPGTDANVAREIAGDLRTAINASLPMRADVAALRAFGARLQEANEQGRAGAYIVSENSLTAIADDLASARLIVAADRQRLRSEIWEARAWNSLRQTREDLAARYFKQAIEELSSADMQGAAVRERLARLHYYSSAFDSVGSPLELRRALALLSGIPAQERSADQWHVLAMVFSGLDMHQEAYASADAARARSPRMAASVAVGGLLFRSAFDAGDDRTASLECDRLREHSPRSMPSVACAALLSGWSGRDYQPAALLRDLAALDEPEPRRAATTRQMRLLIAAAAGIRGDADIADSILNSLAGEELDNNEKVFRAVALRSRGRTTEADLLVKDLSATANGRRTLTALNRLLQS